MIYYFLRDNEDKTSTGKNYTIFPEPSDIENYIKVDVVEEKPGHNYLWDFKKGSWVEYLEEITEEAREQAIAELKRNRTLKSNEALVMKDIDESVYLELIEEVKEVNARLKSFF